MRHRKARLQLNRFTSWRRATIKSLVRNLLVYQSIRTTKTKAAAVKPLADKLISLTKQDSLAAKRQAYRILGDHRLVSLLFGDIASRFRNRIGGYTRILDLGSRRGDNAELVIFELTQIQKRERKKKAPEAKKEIKAEAEEKKIQIAKEKPEEQKPKPEVSAKEKEKPPIVKKPPKSFLGGIRRIFKKERDSL